MLWCSVPCTLGVGCVLWGSFRVLWLPLQACTLTRALWEYIGSTGFGPRAGHVQGVYFDVRCTGGSVSRALAAPCTLTARDNVYFGLCAFCMQVQVCRVPCTLPICPVYFGYLLDVFCVKRVLSAHGCGLVRVPSVYLCVGCGSNLICCAIHLGSDPCALRQDL